MHGYLVTHYVGKHAADAYEDDNVQYKDHLCEQGFHTKALMFYHFVGGVNGWSNLHRTSTPNAHCEKVLIQVPGRDNIVSNHFTIPLQPLQLEKVGTRYDPIMC
jgi:hypothetical protein